MIRLVDFRREGVFLLRQRSVVALLVIAFGLSCFSVITGLIEIDKQRQSIDRLLVQDALDRQQILKTHQGFGSQAYYSFHLTYLAPSSSAFAAIGQRDVMPWKHRIRMLALEGQIHENDPDNPELALIGRFDFSFLMSVLTPLFIILLLHDLTARERAAGRYELLISTTTGQSRLWAARALVLVGGLSLVLILPFIIGALISGAALADTIAIMLMSLIFMALWAGVCGYVSALDYSGPKIASILLGGWLMTAVVLPSATEKSIELLVETPRGGDILLIQREAVNDAWDLPFESTFDVFTQQYPEWQDHLEMSALFEWKWYYAFQQVGDQRAEPLSQRYRQALWQKDRLAGYAAWLSPSMIYQRYITRIAGTDFNSAAKYNADIRDFHAQLRHFYYPYLFGSTEYDSALMEPRPDF